MTYADVPFFPLFYSVSSVECLGSTVDPSTFTGGYWVYVEGPDHLRSQPALGKWLIFRKRSELDKTWHMVRQCVTSGELGAVAAKSSTALDNPNAWSKDTGVICVYTTEDDVDLVGLKLVHMLKHDIRYKTDEATYSGMYANRGVQKTTCKTIYWNDGNPSFTKCRKA
eukprot:Em0011g423a